MSPGSVVLSFPQSPARLASFAECFFALPHCGAWSQAAFTTLQGKGLVPPAVIEHTTFRDLCCVSLIQLGARGTSI